MPNNCQNILTIKGPKEDLKKFEEKSEDGKFQLGHHIPCPEELVEQTANFTDKPDMIAKYGYSDWYGWRMANWGTKWDVYEDRAMWMSPDGTTGTGDLSMDTESLDEDAGEIKISFLSAWGPPTEGIQKISGLWPNLYFTIVYVEAGNGFAGTDNYKAGEMISRVQGEVEDYVNRFDFSLGF